MNIDRKITKLIQTHNKVLVKLASTFIIDIDKRYCYTNTPSIGYGRHWIILPESNPIISLCKEYNIKFIELYSNTMYESLKPDTILKSITELFIDEEKNCVSLKYDSGIVVEIAKVLDDMSNGVIYYDEIELEEIDITIPVDLDNKLFIPIEDGYVFEYTKYLTVAVSAKSSHYRFYSVKDINGTTEIITGNDALLHDIRPYVFNHERDGVNLYHLYLIFRRIERTKNTEL